MAGSGADRRSLTAGEPAADPAAGASFEVESGPGPGLQPGPGRSSKRLSMAQVLMQTEQVVGAALTNFDLTDFTDDAPPGTVARRASRAGGGGGALASQRSRKSIIFNEETEEAIESIDPERASWLSSMNGVAFQLLLCGLLIASGCYVTVFQKIQSKRVFDPAGININISLASLIISLLWARRSNEMAQMFAPGWIRKVGLFALPGCGFALTSYLGILAVVFLSADTAKVLEQTRLLVLAVMSLFWFKKGQSTSGWNLLIVITLASCVYAEMKQQTKELALLRAGETVSDAESGSAALFALGVIICLGNVVLQSGISILCEGLLKTERDTPFYMQKFYMEISGLLFAFLLVGVNRIMVSVLEGMGAGNPGLADKVARSTAGMRGNWFLRPWGGMGDPFWWACFLLMLSKSWLSGLLVKLLSSIVKQLCQVISVGITYFLALVHLECPDQADYFCLGNLRNATFGMVCADFGVILAVVGYALANRDAEAQKALQADAEEAQRELQEHLLRAESGEAGRPPRAQ